MVKAVQIECPAVLCPIRDEFRRPLEAGLAPVVARQAVHPPFGPPAHSCKPASKQPNRCSKEAVCTALLAWAVVTSLLLSQPSLAQEFKAAPPHLRGEGREGLLLRETVQRDLGLTEEQKQAVDKILRAENPIRMTDLYERLAAFRKGTYYI